MKLRYEIITYSEASTLINTFGTGMKTLNAAFPGMNTFDSDIIPILNPDKSQDMKTTLLLSILLSCLFSQAQTFSWVNQLGGTLADRISSRVTDSTGAILTLETLQATVDFNPALGAYDLTSAGGSDGIVLKMTQSGGGNLAKPWPGH